MTPLERAARLTDEAGPGALLVTHEGAIASAIADAVAAEREACAAIAEAEGRKPKLRDGSSADWIRIAAAIRGRGA